MIYYAAVCTSWKGFFCAEGCAKDLERMWSLGVGSSAMLVEALRKNLGSDTASPTLLS